MKTIILAGGKGTRMPEETGLRPKPMVTIGGMPILEHIMRIYASHGHRDFVVACGYKMECIVDYFKNPWDLRPRPGAIELAPTGELTETGGRIRRCLMEGRVSGNEPFMVTYGDGLGNVDLPMLLAFHRKCRRLATLTAVRPPSRFGVLTLDAALVKAFQEKPAVDAGWVNGGFMVLEPAALDSVKDDACSLEKHVLPALAAAGQLAAWRHEGFWQPMDTVRERDALETLWQTGAAPWKTWKDPP